MSSIPCLVIECTEQIPIKSCRNGWPDGGSTLAVGMFLISRGFSVTCMAPFACIVFHLPVTLLSGVLVQVLWFNQTPKTLCPAEQCNIHKYGVK